MKLHHRANLKFFCDDANGEYGVAPKRSIGNDVSFNALWSGHMIFHDVFEHYCEFQHPWFMGNNAMNVGGEMFAMGHFLYYYNVMGVRNRIESSVYRGTEITIRGSYGEVQEAICSGHYSYGDTLKCGVPLQKNTECYDLESTISDYIYRVGKMVGYPSDSEERKFAIAYKKSVTESKITRLHRAGYYAARKLVPWNDENSNTLSEFIEFWNHFTKNNKAEELYNNGMLYLDFNIYLDEGTDFISWKCFAVTSDGDKIKVTKDLYLIDEINKKKC